MRRTNALHGPPPAPLRCGGSAEAGRLRPGAIPPFWGRSEARNHAAHCWVWRVVSNTFSALTASKLTPCVCTELATICRRKEACPTSMRLMQISASCMMRLHLRLATSPSSGCPS